MIQSRSILLVDSDPEAVKSVPPNSNVPIVIARNSQEAYNFLVDKELPLLGIFVSPSAHEPNGLKIIRLAHEWRIGTPLYLLQCLEEKTCYSATELEQLAVHGIIRKPLSYAEVCKIVAPLLSGLEVFAPAPRTETATAPARSAVEDEFVPILAQNFLSGHKTFFDLYVRLDSGRYTKIMRAGDDFNPERLEAYFRKGVDRFYIRKEVQARYLAYCDQVAEGVVKVKDVPFEIKGSVTLNLGHETMNFLRSQEVIDPEYALRFVDMLITFVERSGLLLAPDIQRFMQNLPAYDHGVSVSLVGAFLAREFGLTSPRVQKIIGLSCLFHDLSLPNSADFERRAKAGKLSPEELKFFHAHPLESARILTNAPGVDKIVIESVAQHHERISGHGFPHGLRTGQIHRIAEIVGIADEFVSLIDESRSRPKLDPITSMWNDVLPRFSNSVATAFMSAFF